ncbi:MAG: DUF1653 domain-containing protein [Pseudobdellovibrionaceae bacterium]
MADVIELKPNAKFRHYKGNEYEIVTLATNEADEEPVVVYKALYGNFDIWVRRVSSFCETVDVNGQQTSRFTLVA